MKYAYPQNATGAVNAIKRYDETIDVAEQQNQLDRKQTVASIGETVPMVFCERGDFGNDQGENGGVWMSPKLIQLGVDGQELSMMYLLGQGDLTGVSIDQVYWGYRKLQDADESAVFCTAYEIVPACVDLDYNPGGSIGWSYTRIIEGPKGEGKVITEKNVNKITFNWASNIHVAGSGIVVGGYGDAALIYPAEIRYKPGVCEVDYWKLGYFRGPSKFVPSDVPTDGSLLPISERWEQKTNEIYASGPTTATSVEFRYGQCGSTDEQHRYTYDMAVKHHKQSSWDQPTEVRLDYSVKRVFNGEVVRTGQVWVKDGATSLTISGLEPDQYEVEFSNTYAERDKPVDVYMIQDPQGDVDKFWELYMGDHQTDRAPKSEFMRHTNPGAETREITLSVSQNIYEELKFPDVPGGEGQIVGGFADLTLAGIKGDVLNLRPLEGPDYFLQAHVFIGQGLAVERLLGGNGPSRYYPDLIYHLMKETRLLQADQIDKESLVAAAKMNQAYSLFYNGILQTTNSLAEWMTRTAPYFLLKPRQVDGRYGVSPVVPIDADGKVQTTPITPTHIFTVDEIVEGSYSRMYYSRKDRRPMCLVMVYRDQPVNSVGQLVTIEARYKGTALTGPYEQHDLSDFCCRGEHAVYAARYILAKRRYTTHECRLTVDRNGRHLKPGDIVRVDLDIDTTDGKGLSDQTMYEVQSVAEGQVGRVALELVHFPVDVDGRSLVALDIAHGEVNIQ